MDTELIRFFSSSLHTQIAGIAGMQDVKEIQEVEAESSSGVAALTPTAHEPSYFISEHAEKCHDQGDSHILDIDNELYSQLAQATRRFPNPDGRDFYAARRSRGDDIDAS
jgi:hypothetical protein